MARAFTQRHYVAIADVLVEAYREAKTGDADGLNAGERIEGVHIVRAELVRTFEREPGSRFDSQKFDSYITKRRSGR